MVENIIFRAKNCSRWPKKVLLLPPVRYFSALVRFKRCAGPLETEKEVKTRFFDFSGSFQTRIWPFPELKSVPDDQKWCYLCPQEGILMHWFVSRGAQICWTQKYWRSWKKRRKIDFSGHIYMFRCAWEVLKSDPKAQFWCSLCPGRWFGLCKVVSKYLMMLLRQLKGSTVAKSKKHHF